MTVTFLIKRVEAYYVSLRIRIQQEERMDDLKVSYFITKRLYNNLTTVIALVNSDQRKQK